MTESLWPPRLIPGTRLLELGGGSQPMTRPNMDVRRLPTVDIVHSLDEFPYPIPDNLCDGVLGKFIAEHLSWKIVGAFCDELYRITAPGGVVVLVTPNTEAQCRHVLAEISRTGKFTQDLESMLFGGQGYKEDRHICAWSPKRAEERFFKAGFYQVLTQPVDFSWPPPAEEKMTDLVIEARKSKAEVRIG